MQLAVAVAVAGVVLKPVIWSFAGLVMAMVVMVITRVLVVIVIVIEIFATEHATADHHNMNKMPMIMAMIQRQYLMQDRRQLTHYDHGLMNATAMVMQRKP